MREGVGSPEKPGISEPVKGIPATPSERIWWIDDRNSSKIDWLSPVHMGPYY